MLTSTSPPAPYKLRAAYTLLLPRDSSLSTLLRSPFKAASTTSACCSPSALSAESARARAMPPVRASATPILPSAASAATGASPPLLLLASSPLTLCSSPSPLTSHPTPLGHSDDSSRLVLRCTRLIKKSHTFFWAATPTCSNGLGDTLRTGEASIALTSSPTFLSNPPPTLHSIPSSSLTPGENGVDGLWLEEDSDWGDLKAIKDVAAGLGPMTARARDFSRLPPSITFHPVCASLL